MFTELSDLFLNALYQFCINLHMVIPRIKLLLPKYQYFRSVGARVCASGGDCVQHCNDCRATFRKEKTGTGQIWGSRKLLLLLIQTVRPQMVLLREWNYLLFPILYCLGTGFLVWLC